MLVFALHHRILVHDDIATQISTTCGVGTILSHSTPKICEQNLTLQLSNIIESETETKKYSEIHAKSNC